MVYTVGTDQSWPVASGERDCVRAKFHERVTIKTCSFVMAEVRKMAQSALEKSVAMFSCERSEKIVVTVVEEPADASCRRAPKVF
jgi:hypothetical protein